MTILNNEDSSTLDIFIIYTRQNKLRKCDLHKMGLLSDMTFIKANVACLAVLFKACAKMPTQFFYCVQYKGFTQIKTWHNSKK